MKKRKEKRIAIKMILCFIYLICIMILFVASYKLFQEKKTIRQWSEVETVADYTYIDIDKMSEKFAYYKENNIGIHFVIDKEETGLWHTYIIAINENEYDKYKAIIDYTYERTKKAPDSIRVYGYPVIISEELKQTAIKNISNFLPAENEIKITAENYETYLTNSYLDTTRKRKDVFNIKLCISLFLLFIVIVLFFLTIFDKDKIVNSVDEKVEEEMERIRKIKKIRRKE